MAAKQKFYVVWKGLEPGVYRTWAEAERQIKGQTGALYKSYESLSEAETAFKGGPGKHLYGASQAASKKSKGAVGSPDPLSYSVDAACSGNPGVLEYQGVETVSKKIVFKKGPFPVGTVNIGEFLALVHCIALLKKNNLNNPIYSDSITAMAWVRNKAIKTNLERGPKTEELFQLVDRALDWLRSNTYSNKIIKWETTVWGENPADYGRK
jgi:ribonuclease HI